MDITKQPWHKYDIHEVIDLLKTRKEGLTDEEVRLRLQDYGKNTFHEKRRVTWLDILFRQFENFLIYILAFAAIVSFFLGEQIDFVVIVIIIAFTAFLGFFQDYRAEKSMEALEQMTTKKAVVVRNGKKCDLDAKEVVPGDIIVLERGQHVAADIRLIEVSDLRIDESPLTGESLTITKETAKMDGEVTLADRKNMAYTGTFIVSGQGRGVVVETGPRTEIGNVAQLISEIKQEKTPIQQKLDLLSKKIGIGVLVICAFMFVLGVIRGTHFLDMLLIVAAVSISGIPEAMPAVVTVILATGVKRMAKKNAIIKKLPAVETLGAATVICTDKTGTLTQNKMTVKKIYTAGKVYDVTGEGYIPKGDFAFDGDKVDPLKVPNLAALIRIGILCNDADIEGEGGEMRILGEPTEGSLLIMGLKAGLLKGNLEERYPRTKELPFDAFRKRMSTVHTHKGAAFVFTKGAPDIVINRCTHMLVNGQEKDLSPGEKHRLLDKSYIFAENGLRVLSFAYRQAKDAKSLRGDIEKDLVFVGFVGMRDVPRPGVHESIAICQQAGIKVVMITGDHKATAKTIGQELNIFKKDDLILTGQDLDGMDDFKFEQVVERVSIYARTTPAHKLRIVNALQKQGHVVAMTGDGVNDAPALKSAEIGVAMGKSGTDVAREAAEMVLADDDFSTIVKAIKEGRTIYSNIKKFIYYVLTGSISEVIIIFVAVMMGVPIPLTALMILFVNLVTGDLPAMGLALERSSDSIMRLRPRSIKENILSEYMMLRISELVPLLTLGTISLFMWEIVVLKGPLPKARTLAFCTIIFFELFHIYNARSDDKSIFDVGIFSNQYVNYGILASVGLLILTVYTSFGNVVFGTVPLTMYEWFAVVVMASSSLFIVEIQKIVVGLEIKEREKYEVRAASQEVQEDMRMIS
ncbi:HAD-IC family P-type ATPase [Candidatus Woesearchaeota archaeon]|nr:HAD-IC family P-type ATPase [Candidatus Woesearchaeota archaeon]